MSLLKMKKYSLGKGWNIPGTIEAASEPFIVSSTRNTITLWGRRDGTRVAEASIEKGLVSVVVAELELMSGLCHKLLLESAICCLTSPNVRDLMC